VSPNCPSSSLLEIETKIQIFSEFQKQYTSAQIDTCDKMASTDSSNALPPVKIGTRKSMLARIQTDIVCRDLKKAWPERQWEIHAMSTMGDLDQKTALHEFNAKSLWTTELEALLEKGELDMIVHSLKDLPTQLPAEMALGCIFPRDDARDALVMSPKFSGAHKTLASLPEGSVIGTSSLRRMAQLKRKYTHLKFEDCRGNIGTRLSKLDAPDSPYTALILAAAGLRRVGMGERITSYLSTDNGGMLHAVGQGAIGVEVRVGDQAVMDLLAKVGCEWTTRACLAERSLMRTLEGGCSVPIGVETEWVRKSKALGSNSGSGVGVGAKPAADYHKLSGVATSAPEALGGADSKQEEEDERTDELVMRAIVVSLDGQQAVETEMRSRVTSREEADEFGWNVARKLVEGGAEKILHEITLNRKIIEEEAGGA